MAGLMFRGFYEFYRTVSRPEKIAQFKNQLRGQRRYPDLLLFAVGINTALRLSDLLELRAEHFLDDHQRIKQRFWIKEQKQGKRQDVVINECSMCLPSSTRLPWTRANSTRSMPFPSCHPGWTAPSRANAYLRSFFVLRGSWFYLL